jgi:hypothetical protein
MGFFDSPGFGFLLLIIVVLFLIYLIRKYLLYLRLEKNKITLKEVKFTQVDLIVAIFFIIGLFPIGLIALIFLIKRYKIYKIYGEEIRKKKVERKQEKEERKQQKEELRNKEQRERELSYSLSTLRVIGKVAILLVVMGFFMPITSIPLLGGMNGFDLAEYASNIGNIEGAESTTLITTLLYVSFIFALVGAFLFILLLMKKRIHVIFDLLSIMVSGISWFFAYSDIKDYVRLQIGGQFIFVGLIASFLISLIVLAKKDY